MDTHVIRWCDASSRSSQPDHKARSFERVSTHFTTRVLFRRYAPSCHSQIKQSSFQGEWIQTNRRNFRSGPVADYRTKWDPEKGATGIAKWASIKLGLRRGSRGGELSSMRRNIQHGPIADTNGLHSVVDGDVSAWLLMSGVWFDFHPCRKPGALSVWKKTYLASTKG